MDEMSQERRPSGIAVSIYKHQGQDWSNGGLSSRAEEALLVLPEGGPFEPKPDYPAIQIVPGHLRGTLRAVPYGELRHVMMGGCFVASSDSRFAGECRRVRATWGPEHDTYWSGAVALHDRVE